MIPKECKRLAEVDFPIAVVSKHSVRDKYIRYKPTTALHTWWAQRPLSACRAILLGLLLPDPCDQYCPVDFKEKACDLLSRVQGNISSKDGDLRKALLKFIGDFSNWELSSDPTYLEVSRGLVKAAYPEETPLVVDPFAGGGSIPLEALRLGCETFASDLNPVACLVLRTILEDIPRYGPDLTRELRRVSNQIKDLIERDLAELYPLDPDGAQPIVYLWVRTVRCESPNCGAELPLVRSFWLCRKTKRKWAICYKIIRQGSQIPFVEFETFQPKNDEEVFCGNITGARAECLCCNTILSPDRVRAQLKEQSGGINVVFDDEGNRIGGARLLVVILRNPKTTQRLYRIPRKEDYHVIWKAEGILRNVEATKLPNGLSHVPDENLPPIGTLNFRVQRYGLTRWGDLFSTRQKLALLTIANLIRSIVGENAKKHRLLGQLFAFALDKFARHCNGGARWNNVIESVEPAFGMPNLSIPWIYPESVPRGPWAENYDGSIDAIINCVDMGFNGITKTGQVQVADALAVPIPDAASDVWFTDPPYYNAIAYADFSDFFFVWLKRTLIKEPLLFDPFDKDNTLTPKKQEIVQDEVKKVNGRPKDKMFFEESMAKAFIEGRRVLKEDGIGCVVFAHKTTEGWEALLSGLIKGGWLITGSWPIATERAGRLRARESAALATSVHLVCRPRPEDALVGDWGEVLRELPKRVGDWMERLQSEGIRGADLVFACIGPALEIYSRYSKVVDAEEREIPLGGDPEATEPHRKGFLAYVWEVVGHTALEQVLGTAEAKARNSTAGALEEDARLTALFLWTLQSTNGNGARKEQESDEEIEADEEDTGKDAGATKKKKGYSLIFDVVRRFAQPLGIHLPEWEGRIIETEKGVVRLLSVKERAKQLFGEESISVAGIRIEEQARRDPQMKFDFAITSERGAPPKIKGHHKRKEKGLPAETAAKAVTTTLDRVHAAMLLQASGQTNALRALLKAEVDRGPDFLRFANALSALYPRESEEKRLLDAMLLVVPR
jgi:adenine-specific DNA methylase